MNKNLHETVNLGKSEQQTNSTSAVSAKVTKLEYPSTYNRLNNAFSPQTACDDRLALVSTNHLTSQSNLQIGIYCNLKKLVINMHDKRNHAPFLSP
jgi:hypothetical protein